MLSEEEKKAIEHFKNYPKNWDFAYEIDKKAIEIVLNLISKLQKEIKHNNFLYIKEKNKNEKLLICYNDQKKESDKKDKVIDLAVDMIDNYENQLNICNFRNKEHIKEFLFEQMGDKK